MYFNDRQRALTHLLCLPNASKYQNLRPLAQWWGTLYLMEWVFEMNVLIIPYSSYQKHIPSYKWPCFHSHELWNLTKTVSQDWYVLIYGRIIWDKIMAILKITGCYRNYGKLFHMLCASQHLLITFCHECFYLVAKFSAIRR